MTVTEIKTAIDSGQKVYWKATNYEVIKSRADYLIKCTNNQHCIGLTWQDEITLNGDEKDFFIQ